VACRSIRQLKQADYKNYGSHPFLFFPYYFRLTIVGIFRSTIENAEPGHVEGLIKINGSSILYGVSREIIRANTEPGPWSGIIIPTHYFYEPKLGGETRQENHDGVLTEMAKQTLD
jgi:hypothetical protein